MNDLPDPLVGLVLSGGGATVGFQIGALRYLYDVVGVTPGVISGTSAGSIIAALLAQADDHAEQREVLAEIERQYETITGRSDLMVELEWFTELKKLVPALQRVGQRRPPRHAGSQPTEEPSVNGRAAPRLGGGRPRLPGPVLRLPRWDSTPVRETLSAIWSLGRLRPDFDALLRGGRREQSFYRRGPIFDRMLGPGVLDPERLAGSATELRVAVVGLESGELRYVTGRGDLVDRANRAVPGEEPVAVVDAVHASCAIPGLYRPVRLGSEHYVDGGTRENLPVDVAMTHLGATRCYAIDARPTGLATEASFAAKDMMAIVLRAAAGIMADEVHLAGVARAKTEGAVLVAPEIDVLGVWEVDSGLLSIAKDYGYLRAAEACEEAGSADQQVTRDVVELRRRIWQAESSLITARAAHGHIDPPPELVAMKWELRDLVDQVPASRRPPGAGQWWRGWERHSVSIEDAVTWVADVPPHDTAGTG
ncbi:MAG TPA: patatin-like phospholipase family protein [Microlunatus sp.]|nr:patatin-like phospholipase family protein [Microlunatus sp.]